VWLRDILTPGLALLLIVPEGLFSQQPIPLQPTDAPVARPRSRGLHILVLQGQNAVNSLPTRTAANPAVQVFDYLDQPVEGAEVIFEVAPAGPGGLFDNQKNSITTRTDARGQAGAVFTPNTLPGSFSIRVIAKANDQTVEALIKQTNSATSDAVQYVAPKGHWYKSWKLWTVVLAGAGVGAYFGYRSATSSSTPPTISLSPGPIVIGGR
jgi:hypothetical protein